MFPISISFSSPTVISLSILTAIGAYVLFGPDQIHRKKRGYPSGLINYGNNCFANAIVQCLAASPIFIHWLEDQQKKNKLAKILFDLIQSINGQSSIETNIGSLIDQMRLPQWLSPFEQQDSHEFLLSLLNSLTTNSLTVRKRPVGFAESLQSDEDELLGLNLLVESPLITPHPFQGLQATQLQCTHCKHKNPVSVSLFETLSLVIPERKISNNLFSIMQTQPNFTLQELIGNYLKSEMISHLPCDKCHSKSDYSHRKFTTFSRLADILCFHIVRTTWTNGGCPMKNTTHVSFPDILDMNPFISLSRLLPTRSPSTPTSAVPSKGFYRLSSVLVHLGGVSEAGHFIIYRRRTNNDDWLSISDDYVRECSSLQVFTSMAYILFYERIKKR